MTESKKPAARNRYADKKQLELTVHVEDAPNMDEYGTEWPRACVLVFHSGQKIVLNFKAPKPSKASGKMNGHAGGIIALDDGTQLRVGCNLTDQN